MDETDSLVWKWLDATRSLEVMSGDGRLMVSRMEDGRWLWEASCRGTCDTGLDAMRAAEAATKHHAERPPPDRFSAKDAKWCEDFITEVFQRLRQSWHEVAAQRAGASSPQTEPSENPGG